jgi:hypothetical protein
MEELCVSTDGETAGRRAGRIWRRLRRWSGLAVAAVLTLVVLDSLVGLGYRTGVTAVVHIVPPRSGRSTETTVVFPGYVMSGDAVARALEPYLPASESLVVVEYAQRGVDMDSIYQDVAAGLGSLAPQRLRIYGASMGGMCAVDFLRRYTRAGAVWGEPVLVLDTAPSSRRDIRRPDLLFKISRYYRGGPLASALFAAGVTVAPASPPESGVDTARVAQSQEADAWAGTPAFTSQAVYLADFVAPEPDAVRAVRSVYLQGVAPENDPLILVPQAIVGWQRSFPTLAVATVAGRDGHWHIPIIERPRETLAAVLSA